MMWFNKQHPNCIYLDQRPECEPDIVGDFRDLKEFPDETFKLIIFDPPFWIEGSKRLNTTIQRQYGFLNPDTWQIDLKKGALELWRLLAPYGILLGKWSNYQISAEEFMKFFPSKPLIYQVTAKGGLVTLKVKSKQAERHINEKVKTLWFVFMKIPTIQTYEKITKTKVLEETVITKETTLEQFCFMKIPKEAEG